MCSCLLSLQLSGPTHADEPLAPGYVKGDVISHSYVPIRHWSPKEGLGVLPYLFEYCLMEHNDDVPLETFHKENVRRIDIASQWSTAIMLYARKPHYRDEIINLMIRSFKHRQLIILRDYYSEKNATQYENARSILDKLWQNRNNKLSNPEGDTATGQQLINNILAVKLGDEGFCGLGTDGLHGVYEEFNRNIRHWRRDGQTPFRHIRGWYNMLGYAALNYDGCYASSQADVDQHGRHKLPSNTQAIGVDVYHYWFPQYSPFDPGDLSVPRERVLAHTTEWHRLRTLYYPQGLKICVCKNAHDPKTWTPECWNDTHALLNAIELAGAEEAMMWYIGVAGQVEGTYTTPIETMQVYYDNCKDGPWVALCWWMFGTYKDTHGGLEYYDRTLKHYTAENPEGVPYPKEMLDYWHDEYVAFKMRIFDDVVQNHSARLKNSDDAMARVPPGQSEHPDNPYRLSVMNSGPKANCVRPPSRAKR